MPSNEQFVAVLADLVGSREAPDRADLQDRLREALREWSRPAAAGPEITAGDEVQLLLRLAPDAPPGRDVMAFLTHLTEAVRPTRVLFGLGLGELSTPLRERVGENDGPCFHRAREALATAKRDGRWGAIEGADSPAGEAINALLRLAGDLRGSWTDRQQEVVRLTRGADYRKDVAQQLGVSPSVVTEVLGAARYDAIHEAEEAVRLLLDQDVLQAPPHPEGRP